MVTGLDFFTFNPLICNGLGLFTITGELRFLLVAETSWFAPANPKWDAERHCLIPPELPMSKIGDDAESG